MSLEYQLSIDYAQDVEESEKLTWKEIERSINRQLAASMFYPVTCDVEANEEGFSIMIFWDKWERDWWTAQELEERLEPLMDDSIVEGFEITQVEEE